MTLKSVPSHPRDREASLAGLLQQLEAGESALLLSAAADIALVINPDGTLGERIFAGAELPAEIFATWPGKAWAEVSTIESRPKIEQMLQEAAMGLPPRWRQINHQQADGADIPVRYCVMKAGNGGQFVAIGRDLRQVAAVQQKLLAAEQSIEQEYARLRHAETRYRLLMQVSSEAIVVVDSRTGRIVEANSAAANLMNKPLKRLAGSQFAAMFDGPDAPKVEELMTALRATGRADDVALTLEGRQQQAVLGATIFRQENASFYLMRLQPMAAGASGIVVSRGQAAVVNALRDLPEAFVVTDLERRIISANAAFLDAAQLGSEEQARGEPIDRWMGRAGVDVSVLFNSLAENGAVRQFQTVLRGQFGTTEDVEVSAVASPPAAPTCYGFSIRRASRRAAEPESNRRTLLRSVDEMTKLVGKVPLKDLVRETTDIIERLCIEAALQLSDNNRASAADMLGLSRQSLYVKLHRYGIEDKSGPEEE
ncbi:transcriptional regulator PpsR [Aestuariivirga litoralis]|uniref:transcriptional regulator PpsR n=1 Tax=Aestuariivirga litoralis TaxID=2650924 RepID=UPI00137ADF65|nr:transcriptional regulator PpsR [Aestuariivirga litoralis]